MAKLIISYNNTNRTALLKIDGGQEGWAQIKRICEEHSEQVKSLGPSSLQLPWWAFLSARTALSYYIKRFSLTLEISEEAKDLLKNSKYREVEYGDSVLKDVSAETILARLKSAGFERSLTQEQLRNIQKLIKFHAPATFSVPGSGKTTEALAYFIYHRSPGDKLLIICPKNAFPVWEEQLDECIPNNKFKITRLTGGEKNIASILEGSPDVLLITYQQVINVSNILADFISRFKVFLFLDESHRIKGGTDRVIPKMILSFAHLAYRKMILSGTPMPNSTYDLCPQFSFLYPEIAVDENNVIDLMRNIFVRTTKKELGLPEVSRRLIPIQMNESQQYLYNLLCSEIARQANIALSIADRKQLRMFGRSALRLIQLVSNPSLLARRNFMHSELLKNVLLEGDSPKLQYITIRARQLARASNKVIIWSSFVGNVELIADRLYDLGAEYIHGGVEAGSEDEENTREAKIKRFHEDNDCYVLVANPAACGEGISLHKVCHHAIYLDRIYNAAQYLQSEDRIHRLGLSKDTKTEIEILCCPGTIDISVNNRLITKINRMAEALNDHEINIAPIPVDPDELGFDYDDLADFIDHVNKVALSS